jgi:RimJ/RimL family protein N-acetyltransferase
MSDEKRYLARGTNVSIRLKTAADAPDDYRWRTDPEVMRYDGADPLTISYSEFLGLYTAELACVDSRRQAFAIDTTDGQHIGNVMFYNADHQRMQAELGVSIGEPAFRGRGLGSEALVLFVAHLWAAKPFSRLLLHTFDWNERAQASFQHAGFQPIARVSRGQQILIRMEARREWWLLDYEAGRLPSPSHHDEGASATPL